MQAFCNCLPRFGRKPHVPVMATDHSFIPGDANSVVSSADD
jgi:hypothetical protein